MCALQTTIVMFEYFHAPVSAVELGRRTIVETFRDGCPGLAAQLAFYFLLGLFPALLVLVSLMGYLPVDPPINRLLGRLDGLMPDEVLRLVRQEFEAVLQNRHGRLLTLGLIGALWSSSSAMKGIISALNRAYDIQERRRWWKTRFIAIGLTIALAIFILAAFTVVVGGAEFGQALASWVGAGDLFATVWQYVQWPIAFALVVFALELVYHFAPNAETDWVWVSPGSLLATGLWLLTSLGFRIYLERVGSIGALYGTIGSVIVLLLWFYLSGFAILIGAELNAEIDRGRPTYGEAPRGPHGKRLAPPLGGRRVHEPRHPAPGANRDMRLS